MKITIKNLVTICFILFFVVGITAQKIPKKQEIFISGYAQKVAGNEIKYNSGVEGPESTGYRRV